MDDQERLAVVKQLPPRLSGRALLEMPDETQAEETLVALEPETAGEIVEELPDDEAADLVGALDPEDQQRILAEVEDRADVETLLRYDPETAGGIMTAHVVSVRDDSTAAEAIDALRKQAAEVEDFPHVFVVDAENKVSYRQIKPGAPADGQRIIESGLAAGDTIVVNGLQRIRPGATIAPQTEDKVAASQ